MVRISSAFGAAILSALLSSTTASAQIADMHAQRKEGGRTCMASHFHFRESGAWPTESQARAAVTKSWENFTAAEYGPAWGRLSKAASKSFDCAKGSGTHPWSCKVAARPCR